ncbi:hypothetical protein VVR12_07180 [Rothia sp. LK2588]|uniref:hypothetical protein n=1 Tax=Rothia sp. LK2588 TaxID=3114369 RepID=UPI0034CDE9B8
MTISRRNLAKGAAWAAPVVIATGTVPAYAASTCTAAARSAIDAAFEQVRTKAFTAYWAEVGSGFIDGSAHNAYFNINNNTQYDLQFTSTQALKITFFAVAANGSTTLPNGPSSVSAARGTISPITTSTYNGKQARSWTWNTTGFVLPRNKAGNDSEFDMGIATGINGTTGGLNVCARLDQAPVITPSFASIKASNSAVTDMCLDYYNAKVATAQPAIIPFAGPLLSGAGATWNRDGSINTLCGGSTAWTVGSTICSATTGNYNAVPYPPGCGTGQGYNGIF